MREESGNSIFGEITFGITPAHAGRMERKRKRYPNMQDHPRACGKNAQLASQAIGRAGSPPRIREESPEPSGRVSTRRITPAHTGRIVLQPRFYFSPQDHPRACGKNLLAVLPLPCHLGSPPRMREELLQKLLITSAYRITPAHAGRILYPEKNIHLSYGSPPRMREESVARRT